MRGQAFRNFHVASGWEGSIFFKIQIPGGGHFEIKNPGAVANLKIENPAWVGRFRNRKLRGPGSQNAKLKSSGWG